ncbi:DUF868 family protein [Rhynchospora pubera]|uniref:DUF868 family protein n=1 Tax=Rhynchospora pubera TaxID=906938 RepID=A0AAV8HVA0_9POAL|nr:DUF868 family protein [Rhynchospora pubera]
MVGKTKKSHFSSNILLLPSPMKDFASCFSDHAVRVADVSCSGHASVSTGDSSSTPLSSQLHSRSIQSSAACAYRSKLTSGKELLIRVTWTRSNAGTGSSLSIGVDPVPCNDTSSHILRKKKGTRTFPMATSSGHNTIVALFWDYTSAKFGSGPEPVSGFYVIVVVDSEFALLIGDTCEETVKKLEGTIKKAEFKLASRREQVLGHVAHTTRARFRDGGAEHEIMISCSKKCDDDDEDGPPEEVLSVSVDNKRVVQVRRLKWNFRGNQTIFVDGAPVDLMWDMRDWFFGHPTTGGFANFLFRARSTLDSRLWLEEEQCLWHGRCQSPPFSLLVQSFRTPS